MALKDWLLEAAEEDGMLRQEQEKRDRKRVCPTKYNTHVNKA